MKAVAISALSHTSGPHNNVDNNILNELLAVLTDSKDFFEQAEKIVKDDETNIIFKNFAKDRDEAKGFIQNLLVSRHGVPVVSGTLSGELRKLYTEFMSLWNDDSLRLLEQMTYHEIRNVELIDLLVDSARTTFVRSVVLRIRKDISQTISSLQNQVANVQQAV